MFVYREVGIGKCLVVDQWGVLSFFIIIWVYIIINIYWFIERIMLVVGLRRLNLGKITVINIGWIADVHIWWHGL